MTNRKEKTFNNALTPIFTGFIRFSFYNHLRKPALSVLICGLFLLIFHSTIAAQDLPDKIRGYKVHKAKIAVKTEREKGEKSENFRIVYFDKCFVFFF